MVVETKLKVYTGFREKIPRHHRKYLAFLCQECYSWVWFTRDMTQNELNFDTGIQHRQFKCHHCGKVYDFSGRRGIRFTKEGIQLSQKVRVVIPPELKELMAFKKRLEKVIRMGVKK